MKEFTEAIGSAFSVRDCDGGILLITPIMYQGADHGFSFYLEKNGGGYKINDRGETFEYMRENFDPERYTDKIEEICERFEITLIDGVFWGHLSSLESGQTMRNLFKFLGAMNMIANIDTF